MEEKAQIQWDVNVDKDRYGPGESVRLKGTFRSTAAEPMRLRVHTLLKTEATEEFPVGIVPHEVIVPPNEETDALLEEYRVTDDFPPGQYSVQVGVEGGPEAITFKEVGFVVEGTVKPLAIQAVFSRDREGRDRVKVYTAEDKLAHLRILSEVDDLTLRGELINPDGKETPIRFEGPATALQLTGVGSYTLRLEAEAEGYKTVRRKLTFSVIQEKPEFGSFSKLKGRMKR
jgi:hypothetical protein